MVKRDPKKAAHKKVSEETRKEVRNMRDADIAKRETAAKNWSSKGGGLSAKQALDKKIKIEKQLDEEKGGTAESQIEAANMTNITNIGGKQKPISQTGEEVTEELGGGGVIPITPEDVMTASGVGGAIKTAIKTVGTKLLFKDVIASANRQYEKAVLNRVGNNLDSIGVTNSMNVAQKTKGVTYEQMQAFWKKAKWVGLGTTLFFGTASEQSGVMWGAADNIATSASMGSNALRDSVTFTEDWTVAGVEEEKDRLRGEIDKARKSIFIASMLNPVLGWPRYRFYSAIVDTQEATMLSNFEKVDAIVGA